VEHTFEELKVKTVAELREIAAGIEDDAVKGYSQLNKEHLLVAVCKALKIDTHAHHVATGVDKTAIKSKIGALKQVRNDAKAAKDARKLLVARSKIRRLKRELRKHMA